jgi:hypothetical protein
MEDGLKRIPEMINSDFWRDQVAKDRIMQRIESVDDMEMLITYLFARLPDGESIKLFRDVYATVDDDDILL